MKRRRLTLENLSPRLAMDGAFGVEMATTLPLPKDTSGDGVITPRDALLVINAIARQEGVEVPAFEQIGARVDANRDGRLTPADALVVINDLARLQRAQNELDDARARWKENGYDNYNMIQFSYGAIILPGNHIAVRNGEMVSSGSVVEGGFSSGQSFTVEELFGRIQLAIQEQYNSIQVTYDPTTGAPTSIYFDPLALAIDEEHGFGITSLEEVATARESVAESLASARQAWNSFAPLNYDLSYSSLAQAGLSTTQVSVRGGDFLSDEGGDGRLDENLIDSRNLSVEGLFDLISLAVRQDFDVIDVHFDPIRGVPTFVSLNAFENVADGKLRIGSVDFIVA